MTQPGAGSWSLLTAIERMPGVTILTARGRIGSKNSKGLELAVETARQGSALVIVDLDGVDYISGPGTDDSSRRLRSPLPVRSSCVACGIRSGSPSSSPVSTASRSSATATSAIASVRSDA